MCAGMYQVCMFEKSSSVAFSFLKKYYEIETEGRDLSNISAHHREALSGNATRAK